MKKLFLLLAVLFLASCSSSTETPVAEIPTDPNPDVTSLFAQTCKDKVSSCKQLLCNKTDWIFICSENPLAENKNCSEEKSYDEIMNKYKICSENKEMLAWRVFNYSEKKNEFFTTMTPDELEKKVAEETKKVEEGWESEWLGTFLASAWWALLWWIIANAIFGGWATQIPQRPNNIENNQSVTKDSLNETKNQAKTETESRTEKRKEEFKKRVEAAKKKINSSKKSTTTKSSSSKKRRR